MLLCCLSSVDGADHKVHVRNASITQPTYLETFAHVSPYFDNPLLSNEFTARKLVKGEI